MLRYIKALAFIFLITSFTVSAETKGHVGLTVNVSVEGYFSPKLSEVEVTDVLPSSPAELAGIKVGQKILSIDGCRVPGCPAYEAKELMNKKPGETLSLLVSNVDGKPVLVNIHVK